MNSRRKSHQSSLFNVSLRVIISIKWPHIQHHMNVEILAVERGGLLTYLAKSGLDAGRCVHQRNKNKTQTKTHYDFVKWFHRSTKAKRHILKGHSGAELHIYFLVHLESIYYQIFFYSKIVPNCAVAK